jgi:pimeloyl-ACP methyl ester carboxylesterase
MRERDFYRGVGAAAMAVASAVGAGMLHEALGAARDRRDHPPAGNLVDAGGVRLHLLSRRTGRPGPTVVFESGMASPLEVWSWVQDAVSVHAPTVAYDRAGIGRSTPGPRPRTAARTVAELRAALAAAGHRPPYVLVAHSYGGLLVRHFASAHPDEVAGLVMADVTHPDQLSRSPRQQLGMTAVEQYLRDAEFKAVLGILRHTATAERLKISGLPPDRRASALAASRGRRLWTGSIAEFEAWTRHVNAEVRAGSLRSDVPVAVLVAEQTHDEDPAHLALQREIADLSTSSDLRMVPGADHFSLLMQSDHAAQVTTAVLDVLDAARGGTPLVSRSPATRIPHPSPAPLGTAGVVAATSTPPSPLPPPSPGTTESRDGVPAAVLGAVPAPEVAR